MRAALLSTIVLFVTMGAAASVGAQPNPSTLTITGGASSTFPNPAPSDFGAPYFYNPTPLTFSVTLHRVGASGVGIQRVITVELCATAATLGNGKPLTDLEFSPTGGASYRVIISNCGGGISAQRVIVTQTLTTDASGNASMSSGAVFRMHLNIGDAGPTYGTPLQMILTVAKP